MDIYLSKFQAAAFLAAKAINTNLGGTWLYTGVPVDVAAIDSVTGACIVNLAGEVVYLPTNPHLQGMTFPEGWRRGRVWLTYGWSRYGLDGVRQWVGTPSPTAPWWLGLPEVKRGIRDDGLKMVAYGGHAAVCGTWHQVAAFAEDWVDDNPGDTGLCKAILAGETSL